MKAVKIDTEFLPLEELKTVLQLYGEQLDEDRLTAVIRRRHTPEWVALVHSMWGKDSQPENQTGKLQVFPGEEFQAMADRWQEYPNYPTAIQALARFYGAAQVFAYALTDAQLDIVISALEQQGRKVVKH
jgi:histidinol-phosphate/aromatic aminotransferase/cobyric acid decarboxylase-like protein